MAFLTTFIAGGVDVLAITGVDTTTSVALVFLLVLHRVSSRGSLLGLTLCLGFQHVSCRRGVLAHT